MADHKTIAKSTLLRFAGQKDHKISYFDLDRHEIIDCIPKYYNIQESYYSPEFEKWLSGYVETPIGDLYKKLSSFSESNNFYIDYCKLKSDLIKIIAVQIIRMPETLESIMDSAHRNNIISKTVEDITKQGLLSKDVINSAQKYREEVATEEKKRKALYTEKNAKRAIAKIEYYYQDYTANFAIIDKHTDASFILTPAHHFSSGYVVFIPVAPDLAYVLLDNRLNEKKYAIETIEQEGEDIIIQRYMSITEQNLIDLMPACIQATQNSANKHLIARRSFLQRLIELGELK